MPTKKDKPLKEAQIVIENWRFEYKNRRPRFPRSGLSAAGAAGNSTRGKLDFGRCECNINSLTPLVQKIGPLTGLRSDSPESGIRRIRA